MDSVCIYCADQRISSGIFPGENLYRKEQSHLCSRTQLLFLSRGAGLLSHRRHAVGIKQQSIPLFFLCHGLSDPDRKFDRPAGLRISMSLRLGTGSPLQNPILSKAKGITRRPGIEIPEICGSRSVCLSASGTGHRHRRPRGSVVLQIHLSFGNIDGRHPAGRHQ